MRPCVGRIRPRGPLGGMRPNENQYERQRPLSYSRSKIARGDLPNRALTWSCREPPHRHNTVVVAPRPRTRTVWPLASVVSRYPAPRPHAEEFLDTNKYYWILNRFFGLRSRSDGRFIAPRSNGLRQSNNKISKFACPHRASQQTFRLTLNFS